MLAGQHGDVTMTSPRNSNNSISVANLLKGVEKSDGSGKILSEDNSEENKIIAEAKKNGRYMLAPNGKKSNLNERQWGTGAHKGFQKLVRRLGKRPRELLKGSGREQRTVGG